MVIGVVAFCLDGVSGIPRYAQSVLLEMIKADKKNQYIIYSIKKPESKFLRDNVVWRKPNISFSKSLWSISGAYFQTKQDKIERLLSFEVGTPAIISRKIKYVSVIYDFVWKYYYKTLKWENKIVLPLLVPLLIKRSDYIFCISETTKEQLIEFYHHKKEKCSVAYCGVEPLKKSNVKSMLGEHKYLLSVSTVEPRKNYLNLLRAFAKFKKDSSWEGSLIVAGKQGWGGIDINEEALALGLSQDDFCYMGAVSDEELDNLYSNAYGFVLLPFYEGFGISFVEALLYELPVVASDIKICKEILSDHALYAAPSNVDAIAETLRSLVQKRKSVDEINGSKEFVLNRYSWENAAKLILKEIVL